MDSKTKNIVESYYRCWLENDREGARALLADSLVFRSPQDNFDDADSFLDRCWRFADGFDQMAVLHGVYADDSAYIVYRTGDFTCAEMLQLREGRIAAIYVTFDPTC